MNHFVRRSRYSSCLPTSSLIFDDLPVRDNAPLRQGQPTLHRPIESDQNHVSSTLREG